MSKNNKKINFRVLLVYPNLPMMLVPPLSIGIFTWILRKEGYEVELFDTTMYGDGDLSSPQNRVKYLQARDVFSDVNLNMLKDQDMGEAFQEHLDRFKPDLLYYSFAEDPIQRALKLLRISNKLNVPTICGGVAATADPNYVLSFDEVTIVNKGEGEGIIAEVADKVANGESLDNIPNLLIKSQDGSIQRNRERDYITLNEYSTDFTLFDKNQFVRPMGGKIHRCLPIETYRGCPYTCTYCNSPMHNGFAREMDRVFLRRRTVDNIRREIKHLVDNYDINLLYFIDDSFLARPRQEILDFIEMYKEFCIPFWFNTRPEHSEVEIFQKLKDVGCFRVSYGLESGNEKFRTEVLARKITNEKLLHHFEIIADSGIDFSVNLIIGMPKETRAMVFDTIEMVKQIRNYDSLTVSIFVPYRGTVLRKVAIAEGWLSADSQTTHTTHTSSLNMPQFTAKEIDGLMQTLPLYVEFDKSHWPEIEKIEKFDPGYVELLDQYKEMYRNKRWEHDIFTEPM